MNPIREISFDEWLGRLGQKTHAVPRLAQAMVELTYGCNLRCVHCYNPTHEARNELNTADVRRLLKELADEGCLRVGFTGGELFTRRDAVDILACARQLGLIVNVLTNATMMTPALADQIKSLDVFQVDVSVYGVTPETYEEVTRVRGSFSRFVAGLDLLVQRNVPVLLKLVLLKPNVHEHQAMREFAIARGLRFQVSTDVHPRVDGSLEPLAYRLDPDQAFEVWRLESGEKLAQDLAERCLGTEAGCQTKQIAAASTRASEASEDSSASGSEPGCPTKQIAAAGIRASKASEDSSASGSEPGCPTKQIAAAGTRASEASEDSSASGSEPRSLINDCTERVFHCRCGRSSAAITPQGRLNLCLSIYHPLYDLSLGTIGDGWRRLVSFVSSARPGATYECNGCALTAHCSRGVGDSWLQDRVFDRECIPYFRDLAERKATFMKRSEP